MSATALSDRPSDYLPYTTLLDMDTYLILPYYICGKGRVTFPGSTQPVFHLPGSRPRNVTATVNAPPLAGPEVSLPHSPISADGVKQDMDVSRSSFGDTLSQDGAGQFLLPLFHRIARFRLISSRTSIY